MRNKHEAICYVCGKTCLAGHGHFEVNARGQAHYQPILGKWRVRHVYCKPNRDVPVKDLKWDL